MFQFVLIIVRITRHASWLVLSIHAVNFTVSIIKFISQHRYSNRNQNDYKIDSLRAENPSSVQHR